MVSLYLETSGSLDGPQTFLNPETFGLVDGSRMVCYVGVAPPSSKIIPNQLAHKRSATCVDPSSCKNSGAPHAHLLRAYLWVSQKGSKRFAADSRIHVIRAAVDSFSNISIAMCWHRPHCLDIDVVVQINIQAFEKTAGGADVNLQMSINGEPLKPREGFKP